MVNRWWIYKRLHCPQRSNQGKNHGQFSRLRNLFKLRGEWRYQFRPTTPSIMIRFLIKSAFWLSLAFIVMPHFFPADKEDTAPKTSVSIEAKAKPDSVDQLLANGKTALEIGKLCLNNPAFCENGTSLLSSAASGIMQRSGSLLAYLSERFGTKQELPAPVVAKPELPQNSLQTIPIPTPRASALRALDHAPTGAIPARN